MTESPGEALGRSIVQVRNGAEKFILASNPMSPFATNAVPDKSWQHNARERVAPLTC